MNHAFIDGLPPDEPAEPEQTEPGIACPNCGTVIPEKEVATYAANRARGFVDPANYKPGPGRHRTRPHIEGDSGCACADCRKRRHAAAVQRRNHA